MKFDITKFVGSILALIIVSLIALGMLWAMLVELDNQIIFCSDKTGEHIYDYNIFGRPNIIDCDISEAEYNEMLEYRKMFTNIIFWESSK